MAKKRHYNSDLCMIPHKRIKQEYDRISNEFQKLILRIGYKRAQEFVVKLYLKRTFNVYVLPLIHYLIFNYYCQVILQYPCDIYMFFPWKKNTHHNFRFYIIYGNLSKELF